MALLSHLLLATVETSADYSTGFIRVFRYLFVSGQALINSLFGTIGVVWTIGGILAVLSLHDVHWILGWLAAFVWIRGCWAAVL